MLIENLWVYLSKLIKNIRVFSKLVGEKTFSKLKSALPIPAVCRIDWSFEDCLMNKKPTYKELEQKIKELEMENLLLKAFRNFTVTLQERENDLIERWLRTRLKWFVVFCKTERSPLLTILTVAFLTRSAKS